MAQVFLTPGATVVDFQPGNILLITDHRNNVKQVLELVELTPGSEWMLHLLLEKDLPLIGAFTVTELEETYRVRKTEYEGIGHYAGKMRVNWFQYANTYVEGFSDR